ncbi:DUF1304 family protein [Bradyrhizobium sp. U87765 SZCCT0131]|uniref:DUF1304 family protein n=1 Tax=unclassified Bradyrhizobium TaxID=2631580 RepID=UPI001BA6561B|nr:MULTISPECIES: DUF1304 family protein [unclassified Bradyrhizobium]MBR1218043.1 DUF1304 family protein [Bradyrhizobium sp. U87765 SZCCT0131]MBR1261011.1 DUF1304 family protein [Bradyrhizobium sp. U87765 SZCCT0134]MBR1303541.1 DUF1304 family protein [Bradyrhizobium sp. U87765 SZCCT0110]MBR1319147.1 DUF1304 family protein [Bradyrhizobium sp. U87765 SZCCT0109]MBR1347472.1 DUF1304 family protein [Bradyrhizobium sp. U87765 SZCCT0048]
MTSLTRASIYVTIATFFGFFIIEAVLWTYPIVYGTLLPQLNPGMAVEPATQAVVLKALFINQGFYNLMAAAGGVAGVLLLDRGQTEAGLAFIVFCSIFAVVAAATLLLSTQAYLLGFVQLVFPALTLSTIALRHRKAAL